MRKRFHRRRKRMVRAARAVLERGGVRLAWWILPRLSRARIDQLADVAGSLYVRVARRDRAIIHANLDLVFGTPAGAAAIAARRNLVRAIGVNAVRVLLDCFWFARDSERRLLRHVSLDAQMEVLARGTEPGVLVTGHLGSWELVAQSLCLRGRRGTSVYAPLGGAVTQRFMLRMRMQTGGQTLVPREGAMLPLLRALRRGEFVGLLLDQRTPLQKGGAFVDFLGRKATMSKVAGTLSVRLRVAMHIVRCRYEGDGHYRLEVFRTLPAGHDLDADAVNQWVADGLGDAVRTAPEQWLWMYRRWRHVPPGEEPAEYPFYARPFNPGFD